MKTWKQNFTVVAIAAITVLTLSTCFSDWKDTGNLIINLGGSGGRSIYSMEWPPVKILNDIDYVITLTGKGETITIPAQDGKTIKTLPAQDGKIRAAVSAGLWDVELIAYYDGELYATGTSNEPVDVIAGQTTNVPISMNRAFTYTDFDVYDSETWTAAVKEINRGGNGTNNSRKTYNINVTGSFNIPGVTGYTFSAAYITVNITGEGTISLSSTGSLLRISANQTVTMDGITLRGLGTEVNNTTSLVSINGGTFNMKGGEVSGNRVNGDCGGVNVYGTFTMSGGKVSDNRANGGGGGVFIADGIFTMSGGEVSYNTAGNGGGVNVNTSGTFIMDGGKISGNISDVTNHEFGGGVCVNGDGTFTMLSGEVSGNTAVNGGGVFVGKNCTFTMLGGEVFGNSASYGGGVCVGTTETGGSGTFRIVTGTVYGSGEENKNNTTEGGQGAALYITNGTAEYGTFRDPNDPSSTWIGTPIPMNSGSNYARDATIEVVDGELQ